VLIMEAGPASIFIRMNQTANPVIPVDADITICQSYEECVAQLQRRQFAVSLQQLQPGASASRPELPPVKRRSLSIGRSFLWLFLCMAR